MEDKIKALMKNLGCDYETAKQVMLDDERIDKGEKLFEQTPEQKANSKKYRQGDRKPTVYKLDKRERKADADKRHLIALLNVSIEEIADNEPKVTNIERQIDFEFRGRKFRVVLSAPRTQGSKGAIAPLFLETAVSRFKALKCWRTGALDGRPHGRKFFEKTLDFWLRLWYNNYSERGVMNER